MLKTFKHFSNVLKYSPLVKNSAIFFTGSLAVNIGNYLYNLSMARMLPLEAYGELQSLSSLFLILGIPTTVVSLVIIKYAAHYFGAGQPEKIQGLFRYFTKRLLVLGSVLFGFILVFGKWIVEFLQLSSVVPVALFGFSMSLSFLLLANRAILQGLQKYKALSVSNSTEVVVKLFCAVFFVFLGWQLNGAAAAFVFATFVAYIFSFGSLRHIFQYPENILKNSQIQEMIRYSLPVFWTSLSLAFFYSIDVILVKHFLSPDIAGQYSGLSLLGKTLFFMSGPVITVMFSMNAEAIQSERMSSESILRQSVFLVSVISVAVLAAYFFFPEFIITILLGKKFLPLAEYAGWFALAMVFFTSINVYAQYFLSLHKTRFVSFLLVGAGIQVLLLNIWHDTLWHIVWIMNLTMALLAFMCVLYGRGISIAKKENVH